MEGACHDLPRSRGVAVHFWGKVHYLTGMCVQDRPVAQGIIDIETDMDYILVHGRLRHLFGVVQNTT